MSEIPGAMWAGTGLIVGLFSLYLGFIRPVEYNAFFRLMLLVGIAMLGFGFLKIKMNQKSLRQKIEERNAKRGRQMHVDIDNTAGRHHGHNQHSTHQHHQSQQDQQAGHHHQSRHLSHHGSDKARYCHQCGTPLLPKHKFCPICGTKV